MDQIVAFAIGLIVGICIPLAVIVFLLAWYQSEHDDFYKNK